MIKLGEVMMLGDGLVPVSWSHINREMITRRCSRLRGRLPPRADAELERIFTTAVPRLRDVRYHVEEAILVALVKGHT